MINKIKELILKHNFEEKGILINYEIDLYIEKINKYAVVLPYFSKGSLNGFIAYYANNENGCGFLTLLLIDDNHQGNKLGKLLLETSIVDLRNKGFKSYKLEVLKRNIRAIEFYTSYGFVIEEDRGLLWLMNLYL